MLRKFVPHFTTWFESVLEAKTNETMHFPWMSSCFTVTYFLRVLHFINSGIIQFSENFVKFLTCDYSFLG